MKNRTSYSLLSIAIASVFAAGGAHADARPDQAQELAAKQAALQAERANPVRAAKRVSTKDLEVVLGDTTGGPLWHRPDNGSFIALDGGGVNYPYAVYPFFVSANDNCDISLTENGTPGYDTYLFLYSNNFDPNQPLVNGVDGDDDDGPGLNSLLPAEPLSVGTQYYAVATGWNTGDFGLFNLSINCPVANVTIASGMRLDNPPTNNPVLVAEELIIPPSRTLTNTGALNVITDLDYSFSPGEVRYARLHCPGVGFAPGTTVTYSGDPSNLIGAVNTAADGSIYFSITAGATPAVATDQLIIDGDRILEDKDPVDCTYGLYDFPSQAQAGGPTGRVATTSGAYLRFGPSFALAVDMQGNPIANVESPDPAYSEFVINAPTFSEFEGNVGGFSYGTTAQVNGTTQPITLDGEPIELVDLMDADTALLFSGDFSTANDVYLGGIDCSLNLQSADSFDANGAVFTMGNNDAVGVYLCYEVSGDPIRATEVTVSLAPVSADDTTYVVGDRGPLDLGEITRNGTELQAPLAQIPGGWLSRLVLTNTGTQDRDYEIAVMGETGTVISTNNLTGIVEAQSTLVVDLDTVLTGFTGGLPRATLNVTVAAPNNTIQGLYQIVNPDSGSISNHVMVRPGSN